TSISFGPGAAMAHMFEPVRTVNASVFSSNTAVRLLPALVQTPPLCETEIAGAPHSARGNEPPALVHTERARVPPCKYCRRRGNEALIPMRIRNPGIFISATPAPHPSPVHPIIECTTPDPDPALSILEKPKSPFS